MVADAVVPPSPPSDVFQNRGTRCTRGGTSLGNGGGAVFHLGASGRFLTCPVVGGRDRVAHRQVTRGIVGKHGAICA